MSKFNFDVLIKEPSFDSFYKLKEDIWLKICHIQANGFEPECIIMNSRNYERLMVHEAYVNGQYALETFLGYKIIVLDSYADYVSVQCSARDEWAYGEAIRRIRGAKNNVKGEE